MRSAVAGLSCFRLEDARCHSGSDRENLLKLIAKWFSERSGSPGDEEGEDARRVGFHRFETYVRHAVAPSLIGSYTFYAKILLASAVFATAPCFDMLCSDAVTPNHLLGLLSTMTLLVSLTIPFYLLVYQSSARLVIMLQERYRWPAALAYPVGVLLNNVALVGFLLAFGLSAPTGFFEPDYRLPQEHALDATGRKLLATNLATTVTGCMLLAIAGVFGI